MPSITRRGDKFLAQVRIKQGGAIIFSESKVFDTRAQATSWGERLEAKVKAEGPACLRRRVRFADRGIEARGQR